MSRKILYCVLLVERLDKTLRISIIAKILGFIGVVKRKWLQQIVLLTVGAGIVNFTFQILLARKLSVSNFGYFSAVWSGMAVVGLFTISFQNHATIATTKDVGIESSSNRKSNYLSSITLAASIAGFVLFLFISQYVDEFDNHLIGSIAISISLPISAITAFALGRLLAWRGPVNYLLINLLLAFSKIVIALLVLPFTDSVDILILVLLSKQIVISATLVYFENRNLGKIKGKLYDLHSLRVLLPTTIFWMLFYVDVPLVRLHSNQIDAGVYAGLSNIAKIPLLLSASVNSFLLTSKQLNSLSPQRNDFISKVVVSYILGFFMFLIGFTTFGSQFVEITLGVQYVNQELLILQLLCYLPIMAFGFLLVLNYEKITITKILILVTLVVLELIYFSLVKLSVNEFLLIYSIFALFLCLVVAIRSRPVYSMEKSK
jgi:hypothetical protein